jgi:Flp pilus assembly pilin Flp
MRGSNFIDRLLTAIKAAHSESGAAIVEYVGMMAGIGIMVIASLTFLGGAVGGGWTNVVINAPLANADYGIAPHECKLGGWEDMDDPNNPGSYFINQGLCIQYAITGN